MISGSSFFKHKTQMKLKPKVFFSFVLPLERSFRASWCLISVTHSECVFSPLPRNIWRRHLPSSLPDLFIYFQPTSYSGVWKSSTWCVGTTYFIFCLDKILTLPPAFQVQHIVTETRDKIMQYKSKMVDEADLRRRLASLEESVELHEHMKRQVTRRRISSFSCPYLQPRVLLRNYRRALHSLAGCFRFPFRP